jgi:hypothetical protein
MKKSLFISVIIFLAFAISSCGSIKTVYGPSGDIADAEYVQSVQPVVDSKEIIKFMKKGYFVAGAEVPRYGQTWGVFGTIVITDKTLYFLFWKTHEKTFQVIQKLPIADIINIRNINNVFGDALSIEDKDHNFNLLSRLELFSKENRNLLEQNRELLSFLNTLRNIK